MPTTPAPMTVTRRRWVGCWFMPVVGPPVWAGVGSIKAGGDNSPFANAFIEALKANELIMDGTELFQSIRRPVMIAADQTPEYSDMRNAGHDGGDFLFVRRK